MSLREKVLVGLCAITICGALIYVEYHGRKRAELARQHCDATLAVAAQQIRRDEKCKAMMGSFRSLRRWYERELASSRP